MKVGIREHLKQFVYSAVSKSSFLKNALKRIYIQTIEKPSNETRNNAFKNNAISVLKEFTDCLDLNGLEYTLTFGSLLGAIRERGFINYDLDIDIAIWYDKSDISLIHSCLGSAGFKMVHRFSVDNDESACEETYEKSGVSIDVFYIYDAIERLPYCCDFVKFPDSVDWTMSVFKHGGLLPRRFELPWTRERIRTDFESLSLYIPKNSEVILRLRYGDDYMIPNPHWVNRLDHPYIVVWEDKIAKYTSYDI